MILKSRVEMILALIMVSLLIIGSTQYSQGYELWETKLIARSKELDIPQVMTKSRSNSIVFRRRVESIGVLKSQVATREATKPTSARIEDTIFIGDSNTVRMTIHSEELSKALHISAICGVSSKGWDSFTSNSNTTQGRTIKSDLDRLDSSAFNHVVLLLGTNDFSKGEVEFTSSYTNILEYIRYRNPDAMVNLVTVPPVNDSKSPSISNRDAFKIASFIVNIYETYDGLNLNLIDLNQYLEISDMSTGYGDGYHLSKAGSIKAAEYIVSQIK